MLLIGTRRDHDQADVPIAQTFDVVRQVVSAAEDDEAVPLVFQHLTHHVVFAFLNVGLSHLTQSAVVLERVRQCERLIRVGSIDRFQVSL